MGGNRGNMFYVRNSVSMLSLFTPSQKCNTVSRRDRDRDRDRDLNCYRG